METEIKTFELSNQNAERAGAAILVTDEVKIPPINFTVDVTVEHASIVRLWIETVVVYNKNGRNDSFNFTVEFQTQNGTQTIPYQFNENNLRGGTATSIGKLIARNNSTGQQQEYSTGNKQFEILAQQPKGQLIRATTTNQNLLILCYIKSDFSLFNTENWPVFNTGFGLFRTKETDANRIWNWKNDLIAVTASYNANFTKVKNIPAELRASDPDLYKGLPDFDDEQLKMETWQSYGTGKYYVPKRKQILFFKKWVWVPSSDSDGFANGCKDLETKISQGNTPANW